MSTVGGEDAAESATEVQKLEKLYVWNLPWSFKASDIRELFGQCGTVKNVEVDFLLSFFLSFCRLHPCFFYGWISGLMAVNIVFFWP